MPSTSEYGILFEQFIINECKYLNDNLELDFKFYYLKTTEQQEIDLIIQKPNGEIFLIEIKSAEHVTEDHLHSLRTIGMSFEKCEKMVLCREKRTRTTDDEIQIMPWDAGIKKMFNIKK